MNFEEKLSLEKRTEKNLFDIYLYQEGSFWRAYEWSAYLSHAFPSDLGDGEKLNVLKKTAKGGENYYILIGFPTMSFEKFFPNVTDNEEIFEMLDSRAVIHAESFFKDIKFSEYETILNELKSKIKSSKGNNKKRNESKIEFKSNSSLDSLIDEIISYPIENRTLVEDFNFLIYIRGNLRYLREKKEFIDRMSINFMLMEKRN